MFFFSNLELSLFKPFDEVSGFKNDFVQHLLPSSSPPKKDTPCPVEPKLNHQKKQRSSGAPNDDSIF